MFLKHVTKQKRNKKSFFFELITWLDKNTQGFVRIKKYPNRRKCNIKFWSQFQQKWSTTFFVLLYF